MNDLDKEKMLDLLVLEATGEISEEELEQLIKLKETYPEFKDDISFELAAASISLLGIEPEEKMPAHLQAKILAGAERHFGAPETGSGRGGEEGVREGRSEELQKTFDFEPKSSNWSSLGWLVAALACIALAANLWITSDRPGTQYVQNPTPAPATPTPTPGLAEQRVALLASAGDVVQSSWTDIDPKKPFNVEGDVVWSNTAQKGFLRFRNLPVNDKAKETYQLWIFDEEQKNPISGGVFDADAAGEIIIPIDAAIKVQKPSMFAVTAEKPGGVVVSDREKVLAVAKVSA